MFRRVVNILQRHSTIRALLPLSLLLCAPVDADLACKNGAGTVARALFTTQIVNREPIDHVLILENTTQEVYFFTDLRQLEGHVITHRWEYDGQVFTEKSFDVKGPRWRVYSRSDLPAESTGRWTVLVLDEKGCALKAVVFEYVSPSGDGRGSAIIGLPAVPP